MTASTRDVLCTAEPFGYGPSSALAQIVARLRTPSRLSYAGHGHTLDFATGETRYAGRVTSCAPGSDAFTSQLNMAQALVTVCDFDAAAAARDAGVPFAIYDPLAWYWARIPEVCRAADLYVCQDFFGVRERLAREGFRNATVVPAMTPPSMPAASPRDGGALVSFGGLGNPYFTKETCADYAKAVLVSLHGVLSANGFEPITSLTSKAIASALPVGLEVATLPPADVHARMARASVAFLTPGLGQIYEAAALGVEALWLPPANDSQGQQLRLIVEAGMAPGALDWHEFLDVPPVDYRAAQADVMKTLAGHMRRLLSERDVQARFEACVQRKLDEALRAPDTLGGLIHRFGRNGALACARVIDRWIESLPEAPAHGGIALRSPEVLPPKPRLTALTLPRENRRVTGADLAILSRLHAEVDGTGFNTMAAALEVARLARERGTPPDFHAAAASWHAGGLALMEKYGGAHCTALAEVLRARLQEETGLTGRIVCVRYADSKRPLDYAWDYDGTVHADLLVPYLDERGQLNAAHVVTGMGVEGNIHYYEGGEAIAHELTALGYTVGDVVDPPELGVLALGTKNKLWVVEGPEARDKSAKLGIDVVEGTIFLNGVAAPRYRGPRPAGDRVAFPLSWAADEREVALVNASGAALTARACVALRAFVEEAARIFRQPEDFAENVLFLATHLDAWCDATLCEPVRSLRRAGERTRPEDRRVSTRLERALAAAPSAEARERMLALAANPAPEPAAPWTIAARERKLAAVLRAIVAAPAGATLARAALAAEALRAAEAVAACEPGPPEKRSPDLSPAESAALDEARRGRDPLFAEAFRDPLAEGAIGDVRGALVPPRESVIAEEGTTAFEDDTQDGVRFDAARASFVRARVPRVRGWSLHLRLSQLLDWELETGITFSGRAALAERLTSMARDPDSGAPFPGSERIAEFIADLADAAESPDGSFAQMLESRVELDLTASSGGDRPEHLAWRLPARVAGALLAAIDDPRTTASVRESAERVRLARERTRRTRMASLGGVLDRHRGTPQRHKRTHWAFVNLATAGQTVAEMRRDGGVLPESSTSLDAVSLRGAWGAHERVKLRFVLNDRLEINVLDDTGYWKIIESFGFPPNHETLSATRPILAAGYLTIERGRIVAIEDDGSMIPGKLGDRLPPMLEIVEALGLETDVERVASAMRVLDWSAFAALCENAGAVLADPGWLDTRTAHERLASARHHERPALVVAWLRAMSGRVGRDEASRAAADALEGFRLINVSARAFTAGELPHGAEHVDREIAAALVRKAAR